MDARAEEAAGARHRVIRSAIRAPPKPGSDPSGLSFLAKYRMGRTERPRLAQTPDGPAKAILQPATSSRVLSPPRQVRLGPPSAELAGPGQGWRGRAGQLTPAHPSAPNRAPATVHCGQKCTCRQRWIPGGEAPSGEAAQHPDPGCHFPGLSAVGDRAGRADFLFENELFIIPPTAPFPTMKSSLRAMRKTSKTQRKLREGHLQTRGPNAAAGALADVVPAPSGLGR